MFQELLPPQTRWGRGWGRLHKPKPHPTPLRGHSEHPPSQWSRGQGGYCQEPRPPKPTNGKLAQWPGTVNWWWTHHTSLTKPPKSEANRNCVHMKFINYRYKDLPLTLPKLQSQDFMLLINVLTYSIGSLLTIYQCGLNKIFKFLTLDLCADFCCSFTWRARFCTSL